ncbi:MAG: peptide-methionine (R)-S-oxide reductase MsrB [Acidobacteriota bacterium]|nr:peptide-methionine (R)-S-oxide reductase MsrB [Acidobacteriota bacterium]
MKEYEVNLSEEEWRKRLTPEEFRILRQKGTEYAWTGEYNKFKKKGVFNCAGCGNPLFSSESKYDSGSGWPSYWKPLNEEAVVTEADYSHGMTRTEVLCAKCGGHLGHVFPDGPRPTGQRYCINSLSLDFEAKKDTKKDE